MISGWEISQKQINTHARSFWIPPKKKNETEYNIGMQEACDKNTV